MSGLFHRWNRLVRPCADADAGLGYYVSSAAGGKPNDGRDTVGDGESFHESTVRPQFKPWANERYLDTARSNASSIVALEKSSGRISGFAPTLPG